MPRKKTDQQFKHEVYVLTNGEYTPMSKYQNSKEKVIMQHNSCGYKWNISPNNFLRGERCPKCSKYYHTKWTNGEFLQKVRKQVGNEYTILDTYRGSDTKLEFIHNKCGNHFKMSPYCFLKMNQRCPKCSAKLAGRKKTYTNAQFINIIKNLTNDEYTFLEPYQGSKVKIKVRHNLCGHTYYVRPYKFLDNRRCPFCNESMGEQLVRQILESNNINYVPQKKFSGCSYKRLLPFDFYLSDYNLCIEYDGRQHYMINSFFGGKTGFELYQKRDKIKNKYCLDNNIKLIRVPYTEDTLDKIRKYLVKHGLKLD